MSELKREIYYILVEEVVIGGVGNVENSKKPQKFWEFRVQIINIKVFISLLSEI